MEKRYQVFISSTFQDLQNARQEVSQALLRADCFPAGMELFPAADEEQFEFIKTIIDQSDYYILISAGRYGSIHPETGLSYTEMEYDYAIEVGKPIICLLHQDPLNELKGEFIEKSEAGRDKLILFREKLSKSRLVRLWGTSTQLGAEVLHALRYAIENHPSEGWLRSDVSEVQVDKTYIKDILGELDSILRNFKGNYVERRAYQDLQAELEISSAKIRSRSELFSGFSTLAKFIVFAAIIIFLAPHGFRFIGDRIQNREMKVTMQELVIANEVELLDFESADIIDAYVASPTAVVLEKYPFQGDPQNVEKQGQSPQREVEIKIPDASQCKLAIQFEHWSYSRCVVRDEVYTGWLPSRYFEVEAP